MVTKKGDNPDVLVKGLMAAGEAACASVHGANRLGANSLLDIVVFGRAVANRTKQILKPGTPLPVIPASVGEESIANIDRVLHASGPLKTADIRLNMQKTMQQVRQRTQTAASATADAAANIATGGMSVASEAPARSLLAACLDVPRCFLLTLVALLCPFLSTPPCSARRILWRLVRRRSRKWLRRWRICP